MPRYSSENKTWEVLVSWLGTDHDGNLHPFTWEPEKNQLHTGTDPYQEFLDGLSLRRRVTGVRDANSEVIRLSQDTEHYRDWQRWWFGTDESDPAVVESGELGDGVDQPENQVNPDKMEIE